MTHRHLALFTLFALAVAARPAHADAERFSEAIYDYTRETPRAWVVTRLMKFEVGAACWDRISRNDSPAVEAASWATSDILDYASRATGVRIGDIQDQRELAKAMTAARDKVFITVRIEGDDCPDLWTRYWTDIGRVLESDGPAKAMITLEVSSKVRGVSVEVNGSAFTIRAPKAEQDADLSEKLEKAFRQQNLNISDDFAYEVEQATRDKYAPLVITRLHTFKVGKRCRARFADKKNAEVVYTSTFTVGDIQRWGEKYFPDEWKAFADKSDLEGFAKHLSVTISVDGDDCDVSNMSAWLAYWQVAIDALRTFPPKANKVAISIRATGSARGVSATSDRTGSTFTITGPNGKRPPETKDKIYDAFMKVTRDQEAVAAERENAATSAAVKAGKNPWPRHGRHMSDSEVRDIPSYENGREYTKGAIVSTGMSSNPHTLVFRCKIAKCDDSPGVSSQWLSVGWAHAE